MSRVVVSATGVIASAAMGLDVLIEHRSTWNAKPVLADIYAVWFEALLDTLGSSHRRVLELGAGPGFLSEYARGRRPDLSWIAADILPAPWNDVAADGLCLPFRSGAFDTILAVDLLHHLARPRLFFEEAARRTSAGPTGPVANATRTEPPPDANSSTSAQA